MAEAEGGSEQDDVSFLRTVSVWATSSKTSKQASLSTSFESSGFNYPMRARVIELNGFNVPIMLIA